jgi:hypothetical protein
MRSIYPAHLILLDLVAMWKVQVMKNFTVQFYLLAYYIRKIIRIIS